MKLRTFTAILILILFASPFSVFAQQDTLSWSHVIDQPWIKPARLDSLAGVHPRMLLDSARVEILKAKIVSSHQFIWDVVKGKADSYLSSNPRNNPGDEDETRADGDAIPWIALAYLMTGDAKYLNKAVNWMTTVCNYPEWDGNQSLGAGHCLMGVSLGYDWVYNFMTSSQRLMIRDRLSYFAPAMASNPQHKERYLSNHCQVEYVGLAAAGFALYDEVTEAENWLRQAYNIFNEAFQICGNDGSSTEGHQYYGLMTEFQMHFDKMAKELLGRNFYQESEWLKNLGNFILYCTLPDFTADKCVMRYGDTTGDDYQGHGPIYQLLNIANEYRNPYFQWLALEMSNRRIGVTDRMGWASLLWYDETVPSTPPYSLPMFQHFEDTGWITSRSNWGSDAIMIGFKCGPFHGHAVQELYNNMTSYHGIVNGHGHPDVNHFNIYAYGKWLAKDDGYSKPKWTKYHNTIIVNGYGQLGEGTTWFDRGAVFNSKATSRIIKAESNSALDYIIGDAQNIFKPAAGLQKFFRHFVYVKPNIILILDELKANQPSKFEWLMHTDGMIAKRETNKYKITHNDVAMDIDFLLPEAIADNSEAKLLKISPSDSVAEMLILAAMHIRKANDSSAIFQLISQQDSILHIEISIGTDRKSVPMKLVSEEDLVGVVEQEVKVSQLPESFYLCQNYPNPFNPITTIQYWLPITEKVHLRIYNLLGQQIRTLVSGVQNAGSYKIEWDGSNETGQPMASGIYLCQLGSDNFASVRKMILWK
ncbi:MAG TPA: DUF4962 domain-containing protein [bacterium]